MTTTYKTLRTRFGRYEVMKSVRRPTGASVTFKWFDTRGLAAQWVRDDKAAQGVMA